MKADSSFVKRIKRLWFDEENLFVFEIQIWLFDISIAFITILFDFKIRTYVPLYNNKRIKTMFSKILRFKKHKCGNIELWFRNDLKTGITIYKHIHCDHTPFELEINILGFTFWFYHYDTRHWDDDNDRYEE